MIQIKRLHSTDPDFQISLERLLAFENAQDDAIDATVANILADIRKRKDAALIEFTNRFDRLSVTTAGQLELTQDQLQQSLAALPSSQRSALEQAAERIQQYHEKQPLGSWQYTEADGTLLGQKVTPLDRVGLYVPGGKAFWQRQPSAKLIAYSPLVVHKPLVLWPMERKPSPRSTR